jgi:hypothetical protein
METPPDRPGDSIAFGEVESENLIRSLRARTPRVVVDAAWAA